MDIRLAEIADGAIMHGRSRGDGTKALHDLAAAYEREYLPPTG